MATTTRARVQLLLESAEQRDMTTMTTPTTKGSDDSIILLGWGVALVGPGQYPRYTSAIKDGRPWAANATDKAAEHHWNTTGTRSTPKFSLKTSGRRHVASEGE